MMKKISSALERGVEVLCCPECRGHLTLEGDSLGCLGCSRSYPIVNGVPRLLKDISSEDRVSQMSSNSTTDHFGEEWRLFREWGFIDERDVPSNRYLEYRGGTIEDRKKTFDRKCRLTNAELGLGRVVLDAGCGNGRYTFETASRGDALVIGVDLAEGAVESARENNRDVENVLIIQASLFYLPIRDQAIDACFSNGVLMHTGDAEAAFNEVARTISDGGTLVVNVYRRLNPIFECVDAILRSATTRMSVQDQLRASRLLKNIGLILSRIPHMLTAVNLIARIQTTTIHMYDWYAPKFSSRHTYDEVMRWFDANKFDVEDPPKDQRSGWHGPWAVNMRGIKRDGNV